MAQKRTKRGQKHKQSKNAYKKQPAMLVYVKDWLTSIKLKRAGLEAKGLWADFMFQTSLTENAKHYGVFIHYRLENDVKILLDNLLKQKEQQNFEDAAILIRDLILQKRQFCSTFEDIIGTSTNKFVLPLARLLLAEVCKINENGYLYSSRMSRDADLSEKRAAAGKKGGRKTQENMKHPFPGEPENENNFASDFALSKGAPNVAIANAIANNTPINNNVSIIGESTERGIANKNDYTFATTTPDIVSECYAKNKNEVDAMGVAWNDFITWKKFVDKVAGTNEYRTAFNARFVFPQKFASLLKAGFTEDKWDIVLTSICGLGFKAEQDLGLRIETAMRWPSVNKQFKAPAEFTNTKSGFTDEVKMRLFNSYSIRIKEAYENKVIDKTKFEYLQTNLAPGIDLETLMREYDQQQNHASG